MKILIVDDDAVRREALINFLTSASVIPCESVYYSTCYDDAMAKLRIFHFDILILDVVIPKRIGETPAPNWSYHLLRKLVQSTSVFKPGKIIGITGHMSDLGAFQERFQRYCLVVIEAPRNRWDWKKRIADSIGYHYVAQAHREISINSTNVITIHGIRTFGQWQNRLRGLTHHHLAELPFHDYKYGYMSFLALFSKKAHHRYVARLTDRLQSVLFKAPSETFVIFSHSFGTYLVIESLRQIAATGKPLPIRTLVLAGSVLKSDCDLQFLSENKIQVINDCAQFDYVLWLSEAFVPGLGMAGKCGFYGFNDKYLINRFSVGGHSRYFEGEEYMKNNWLPLISGVDAPRSFDDRISGIATNDVVEPLVCYVGRKKDTLVKFIQYFMRHLPQV